MWKALSLLNQNLVLAIPLSLALGLGAGLMMDPRPLKGLVLPLTFLMVYPMMVNLRPQSLLKGVNGRLHLATALINFGVVPFVAYGLGRVFFPASPYLALGLLMASLVPTSGMTISWTGMAKGSVPAAIQLTVVGLLVGSLATPFYVQALLGAHVQVAWKAVLTQIAVVVFLPLVLGMATQRLLVALAGEPGFQKDWAPRFPGLSSVGVLGVVAVAMALKAQDLVRDPWVLPRILAPLALLYALNFAVSTWIGRRFFPRGEALAMVFGTVLRNLSIALAVSMTAFGARGAEAALVIALAYVLQVTSAAWYARLGGRLFPEAEAK